MEFYIVQLEFRAAFYRESHSGLLFKLKSIGVGDSVLSLCRKFFSNHRQRVVVDGAILASRSQSFLASYIEVWWVLFCSSFIPVKCLSWWRTDYIACADDSTLVAVVRKTADRPAVAASLNRDLSMVQEWCNHWCMILNPNKTKTLVVSRSGTVDPPHGDLVLSGVSICAGPNLDILGVKFDRRLTFEYHVLGIVARVSQRFGILRLVKRVFDGTFMLLRCYYAFVHPILEYCSPVWGSAAECHFRQLERQVYWVGRLCPDQTFSSLYHRRHVDALCMLYQVNSNSNHCLFSELPSDSVRVRQLDMRLQLIQSSLKY